MKAGRRHELKENDLAHALRVTREYLDQHGTHIGIGVVVVAIVIAVAVFGLRSRAVAIEDVWRRKSQLPFDDPKVGKESLEALAVMTRAVSDKDFVLSSLIEQGQQALRLAQDVPFPPDRELNEIARGAFETLLVRFKDNALAFGLAHSGLATVEENAFALDRDPAHRARAEAHLSAIVDNPALNGMPLKRIAMDRHKALNSTFTIVTFEQPPWEEPAEGIDATAAVPAGFEPVDSEPVDELDLVEPIDTDYTDPVEEPVDEVGESVDSTTTSPAEYPGADEEGDRGAENEEVTDSEPGETP